MAAAALGVLLAESPGRRDGHELTDFEGAEHHAAISRDGKFVAFLSDRDGTWDAWAPRSGPAIHNLTKGGVLELRNPATRTVGFSPTGRWSPSGVRAGLRQGRCGRCGVGRSYDGRPASALLDRHL